MTQKPSNNLADSVRQRLLNIAKAQNQDFQFVLTRYALERLLYRLEKSPHSGSFVLKGAMVFLLWTDDPYRPTMDLDLLGFGEKTFDRLTLVFKDLCQIPCEDGIEFRPESVSAEEIRGNQEYGGVRVNLIGQLGAAIIPIRVDIGFGDVVKPRVLTMQRFPVLLSTMEKLLVRSYTKESVIAEKFEAMIRLGIANSRMKDFYDIWVLQAEFDHDGRAVATAIEATFRTRKTPLPISRPISLEPNFAQGDKQTQWRAFVRRTRLRLEPADFKTVLQELAAFLLPPVEALAIQREFRLAWSATKRAWLRHGKEIPPAGQ